MSDRTAPASHNSPPTNTHPGSKTFTRFKLFFSLLQVPLVVAVVLYQVDPFEPAEFPLHELTRTEEPPPLQNARVLQGAEFVGAGRLKAPEDIAYEAESGVVYTGCADGWIKRVRVNDSAVEDWVNTGGRPLGLAFGRDGEVIVVDAAKVGFEFLVWEWVVV